MKKYFKYNIVIALAVLAISMFSCNTAEQDSSSVISPGDYPVATFTTDFTGSTISEGDTIMYTITLDKTIDWDLNFSVTVSGGTIDPDNDLVLGTARIAPYKTEAELMIVFIADNYPEVSETVQLEVGLTDLAEKYLVNPSTVNPTLDLTVTNVNSTDGLTLSLLWEDDHDDFDLIPYDLVADDGITWAGATGADPEIAIVPNTYADGTYPVLVDPYDVASTSVDYTFGIGYPDQTVEFYSGTWDMSAISGAFSIAEIVKAGSSYTVTIEE